MLMTASLLPVENQDEQPGGQRMKIKRFNHELQANIGDNAYHFVFDCRLTFPSGPIVNMR